MIREAVMNTNAFHTRTEQPTPRRVSQSVFNEETRRAIEEARQGIGLTKGFHSAAELFAALDAE